MLPSRIFKDKPPSAAKNDLQALVDASAVPLRENWGFPNSILKTSLENAYRSWQKSTGNSQSVDSFSQFLNLELGSSTTNTSTFEDHIFPDALKDLFPDLHAAVNHPSGTTPTTTFEINKADGSSATTPGQDPSNSNDVPPPIEDAAASLAPAAAVARITGLTATLAGAATTILGVSGIIPGASAGTLSATDTAQALYQAGFNRQQVVQLMDLYGVPASEYPAEPPPTAASTGQGTGIEDTLETIREEEDLGTIEEPSEAERLATQLAGATGHAGDSTYTNGLRDTFSNYGSVRDLENRRLP